MIKALKVFEAEDLIDKPIGTLSGGQLQRVLLSMAIYDEPKLLILDEPVSGIDTNGMKLFYDKMRYLRDNFDMAILIVSHDLEYVYKYADNVLLLDNTILANGSAADVYRTKAFDEIFGGFKLEDAAKDLADEDFILRHEPKETDDEPFDASYVGKQDKGGEK